jgi:hypothetical protein
MIRLDHRRDHETRCVPDICFFVSAWINCVAVEGIYRNSIGHTPAMRSLISNEAARGERFGALVLAWRAG